MPTPTAKRDKRAAAPRFRKWMTRNILTDMRFERGLRGKDIAKAAGVSVQTVQRLERGAKGKGSKGGKIPRNHPAIPNLALAYGVTVEDLAPFLGPENLSVHNWRNPKRAPAPTPDTIAPGKRIALAAPATTKAATTSKRGYNKLTRVPLPVRQLVRALVSETNTRIMEGATELILPPMPISVVHGFVSDYLKAKGIDATMLLDPNFASHFD